MNPAIAPMAVAANVVPNDSPSAKPAAGAKNVLTNDAKTTVRIFQNIFVALNKKICIFATRNYATLAQLVEQRIRNA